MCRDMEGARGARHAQAPHLRHAELVSASMNTTSPDLARTVSMDPETSSRSEEHTSELQSLMRISYAVFCLKKKKKYNINTTAHCNNTYSNRTKVTNNTNKYTHRHEQN